MNTLQSGDGDIQVMNIKASEHLEVMVTWREPLAKIVQYGSVVTVGGEEKGVAGVYAQAYGVGDSKMRGGGRRINRRNTRRGDEGARGGQWRELSEWRN
jgi:hypothetical protein